MTSHSLVAYGSDSELRAPTLPLIDPTPHPERPRESAITQTAIRILRPVLQRKALADVSLRLQEPLESLLRLTSSLDPSEIDALAARTIDQHARALDALTDFIDELLKMSESTELREARSEPRLSAWSEHRFGPATAISSVSRIYRVLTVSDDRALLTALRLSLLCSGCSVAAFRSMEDAIQQVRRESRPMDLLITDLDSSVVDHDLGLIEQARQFLGQAVPAVLLLDPAPAGVGAPAVQDSYLLRKPINLRELTQLVSSLRERANKQPRD